MRALRFHSLAIFGIVATACSHGPRPIMEFSVGAKVYDVALDISTNSLMILSEQSLAHVTVLSDSAPSKAIELGRIAPSRLGCTGETCWVGGGHGQRGSLIRVNTANGNLEHIESETFSEIYDVVLVEKRSSVLTAHANGDITEWDQMTGRRKRVFSGRPSEIFAISSGPEGDRFCSGSSDGTLQLWSFSKGRMNSTLLPPGSIYFIARDSAKRRLIIGGGERQIYLLDEDSLAIQSSINLASGGVMSCDYSPLADAIVCGHAGGLISIIQLPSGSVQTRKLHDSDVLFVGFVSDRARLVTVAEDGTGKVLDSPKNEGRVSD